MVYILSSILLWSSLGLIIRFSGVPIHLLIFFSSTVSVIITVIILLLRRRKKEIPAAKGLLHLLILGPLSLLNTFSFFYAYKNTSIANTVLTHYTAPLLVAVLAPIFLKERLTRKVLVAILIASLGLWVMFGMSAGQFLTLIKAGDKNTGGILAGLFSGFTYAVVVIIMRVLSQSFHPLIMTFSQNLIIAAILLPFAEIPRNFSSVVWAFAIMGVLHSTVGPILYFKGLQKVTANRAAALGYLEPVCAIILGAIFLGEAVSYKTITGGVLILFSGYLTLREA